MTRPHMTAYMEAATMPGKSRAQVTPSCAGLTLGLTRASTPSCLGRSPDCVFAIREDVPRMSLTVHPGYDAAGIAALINLQADRLDHGAPSGNLGFKQLLQLLRGRALGDVAGFGQLLLDRRVAESCIGIGADLADDLRRGLDRNEQRLPGRHVVIRDPRLCDGRQLR